MIECFRDNFHVDCLFHTIYEMGLMGRSWLSSYFKLNSNFTPEFEAHCVKEIRIQNNSFIFKIPLSIALLEKKITLPVSLTLCKGAYFL